MTLNTVNQREYGKVILKSYQSHQPPCDFPLSSRSLEWDGKEVKKDEAASGISEEASQKDTLIREGLELREVPKFVKARAALETPSIKNLALARLTVNA